MIISVITPVVLAVWSSINIYPMPVLIMMKTVCIPMTRMICLQFMRLVASCCMERSTTMIASGTHIINASTAS